MQVREDDKPQQQIEVPTFNEVVANIQPDILEPTGTDAPAEITEIFDQPDSLLPTNNIPTLLIEPHATPDQDPWDNRIHESSLQTHADPPQEPALIETPDATAALTTPEPDPPSSEEADQKVTLQSPAAPDIEVLAAEALGMPKDSRVIVTQSSIMEAGMSMIEAESPLVEDMPFSAEYLTRSLETPSAPADAVDPQIVEELKLSLNASVAATPDTSASSDTAPAPIGEVATHERASKEQSLEDLSAAATAASRLPADGDSPIRKRRIISLRPKFLRPKETPPAPTTPLPPTSPELQTQTNPVSQPVAATAQQDPAVEQPADEGPIAKEPLEQHWTARTLPAEMPPAEKPATEKTPVKKARVVELKPRKLSSKAAADVPLPSPASAGRKIEPKDEPRPSEAAPPAPKKARVVELKPRKLGSKPPPPSARPQSQLKELRWPWQSRSDQPNPAPSHGGNGRGGHASQREAEESAFAEEDSSTSVGTSTSGAIAAPAEVNTRIVESKTQRSQSVEVKPAHTAVRKAAAAMSTVHVEVKAKGGDPRLQTADALLQKLLALSPDAFPKRAGATGVEGRPIDFWLIALMVMASTLIYFACSTIFSL